MNEEEKRLTDAELFNDIRKGGARSKKAYIELYNRYSSRVYMYCKRFLNHREEAKDAFQETFIRVYECAQQERTMTNIPAFILRIARNECVNIKRHTKPSIDIDEISLPTFDSSTEKKEMLELIAQALNLLPDEFREVFILREFEGFSYDEIAEITDTKLSMVKIRIFRAKKQIRKILAPYLKDIEKNI